MAKQTTHPRESIYEVPLPLLKKDTYKSIIVSFLILCALLAYSFTQK